MGKIIEGDRVGKEGKLGVGCSAAVFDEKKERILLIRRADNGQWDVPGGYMEPGENFVEACAREVFEETGLRVQVIRLISIYTDPHVLVAYPDGNRWQLVILHFEGLTQGGKLSTGEETAELRFFTPGEIPQLDMGALGRLRVLDAFIKMESTIIRNDFQI
jgi:ADP-ribose pyrophosphatase YjhB (NUDIX family)